MPKFKVVVREQMEYVYEIEAASVEDAECIWEETTRCDLPEPEEDCLYCGIESITLVEEN